MTDEHVTQQPFLPPLSLQTGIRSLYFDVFLSCACWFIHVTVSFTKIIFFCEPQRNVMTNVRDSMKWHVYLRGFHLSDGHLGQLLLPHLGQFLLLMNMTSSENSRDARLLSPKWTLSRPRLRTDILSLMNENGDKVHPFRSPNFLNLNVRLPPLPARVKGPNESRQEEYLSGNTT